MAEWPNASVSKTDLPQGNGGSNPSSSVSLSTYLIVKRDGKVFCVIDKVFVIGKDCEMVKLSNRTD